MNSPLLIESKGRCVPLMANGHFHRRFYRKYLHASRLTFNCYESGNEESGNSRCVLRHRCSDCCSRSISEQSLSHRRSAFPVDGAASISASGRPVLVLAELVWNCSANVFGHAKSPFKFVLHGPGRHLPWLERAGNAWRFPRSGSRGHTRNVLSVAALLRFTATCRPPHAFHARLPGLGNGSNVRCLAAGTVGVVSRELVAWARAS